MADTNINIRSQELKHPTLDCKIQTPILIPSFSSKAIKAGSASTLRSDLRELFSRFAYQFSEAFLISAFDYAEGYIPPIGNNENNSLVFVDSGGYETSTLEDVSEVYQSFPPKNDWDQSKLEAVLTEWPQNIPSVFVNYDSGSLRLRLEDQVHFAVMQKGLRTDQLWSFLIKPEHDLVSAESAIEKIPLVASDLNSFDIIGITEKELGSSGYERIKNVGRLRRILDDSGISAPIHVFGSLDPTTVRLYFLAGAEVFDGLSWLRFGFHEHGCSYLNEEAFKIAPLLRDSEAKAAVFARNIIEMNALQEKMRSAVSSGDVSSMIPSAQLEKILNRALN